MILEGNVKELCKTNGELTKLLLQLKVHAPITRPFGPKVRALLPQRTSFFAHYTQPFAPNAYSAVGISVFCVVGGDAVTNCSFSYTHVCRKMFRIRETVS